MSLAGVSLSAAPAASTNAPAREADSGTPAEKDACGKNLRRIYDAIQAYRADQRELPNWLSDLVPKYLDDVTVLTCPVVRRTGRLDTQALADPKLPISYGYQFGNQRIPDAYGGGSQRTMREWKQRQVALVGDIVPMVRCRLHAPQLNVSYGGRVFESPAGWESMMTNKCEPAALSVARLFPEDPAPAKAAPAAAPPQAASKAQAPEPGAPVILRIPPRDPRATAAQVDLTEYYNAALTEAWHARPNSGYKHSDLSWLPQGLQTFAGVEFDVRGVIQLAGRGLASKRFPAAVNSIKVNRKCRALHFLHSTGWSVPDGTRIGHFRVSYADGERGEIPITYGVEVRDWTMSATRTEPAGPGLTLAWTGKSPITQEQGTTLRLFRSTWENTRPGTSIDTLDYVSAMTNCAPFLIAITAE